MGGCLVGPKHCYPTCPEDEPTSDEAANAATVSEFIASVWSYQWTPRDDPRTSDSASLPAAVSDAIDRLLTSGYVRHRGEFPRDRTKGCGRDDFKECVRKVHDICGNIRITILGLLPKDDLVTTLLAVEGRDEHPDGSAAVEGVLNRSQPSGRQFRAVVSAVYRLDDDHRIAEDWTLADTAGLLAQLEGGQS